MAAAAEEVEVVVAVGAVVVEAVKEEVREDEGRRKRGRRQEAGFSSRQSKEPTLGRRRARVRVRL